MEVLELNTNKRGFTLIELMGVILVTGILGAVAVPQFMDYRNEARHASAAAIEGNMLSAIKLQTTNAILRCNNPELSHPSIEALRANDITIDNACAGVTLPISERRFLASDGEFPPRNPVNGLNTIGLAEGVLEDKNFYSGTCSSSANGLAVGWCYNPYTGALWASTNLTATQNPGGPPVSGVVISSSSSSSVSVASVSSSSNSISSFSSAPSSQSSSVASSSSSQASSSSSSNVGSGGGSASSSSSPSGGGNSSVSSVAGGGGGAITGGSVGGDDDDGNNGHGNDEDGCDESNPGNGGNCSSSSSSSSSSLASYLTAKGVSSLRCNAVSNGYCACTQSGSDRLQRCMELFGTTNQNHPSVASCQMQYGGNNPNQAGFQCSAACGPGLNSSCTNVTPAQVSGVVSSSSSSSSSSSAQSGVGVTASLNTLFNGQCLLAYASVNGGGNSLNLTSMGMIYSNGSPVKTVWRIRNPTNSSVVVRLTGMGNLVVDNMTIQPNTDVYVNSPSASGAATHVLQSLNIVDGILNSILSTITKAAGTQNFSSSSEATCAAAN